MATVLSLDMTQFGDLQDSLHSFGKKLNWLHFLDPIKFLFITKRILQDEEGCMLIVPVTLNYQGSSASCPFLLSTFSEFYWFFGQND